jgi:ferrous iron transport protein A
MVNFLPSTDERIFVLGTMAELKAGDFAEITGYTLGNAAYRAKLLALGLTHGVRIRVVNVAPLGDPFEIAVRGYHLSLRKNEVGVIKVKKLRKEDID